MKTNSKADWRETQARVLAARLGAVRPLLPGFLDGVIRAPWALVSPATRLSDFESLVPRATMRARILARYGLAVVTLPDDLVVTLLEAVAARGPSP